MAFSENQKMKIHSAFCGFFFVIVIEYKFIIIYKLLF